MGAMKDLIIAAVNGETYEPYTIEVRELETVREVGYDDEQLEGFCAELCKLLEGLTGYRAPFLQEVMDEQIEDAMDMYGSPISGITNTLAVALELDI